MAEKEYSRVVSRSKQLLQDGSHPLRISREVELRQVDTMERGANTFTLAGSNRV